jgi:hypothetical protein
MIRSSEQVALKSQLKIQAHSVQLLVQNEGLSVRLASTRETYKASTVSIRTVNNDVFHTEDESGDDDTITA